MVITYLWKFQPGSSPVIEARDLKKEFPYIKLIYTRSTDEFIGLANRAKIANKAGADLFISIHANAVESRKAAGFESWVLGLHKSQAALEVAKFENSAILMEDDHEQTYPPKILELFSVARLGVGYYSTSVIDSAVWDVPYINLDPGHLIFRDGAHRELFRTETESLFSFDGVVWNYGIKTFLQEFPEPLVLLLVIFWPLLYYKLVWQEVLMIF